MNEIIAVILAFALGIFKEKIIRGIKFIMRDLTYLEVAKLIEGKEEKEYDKILKRYGLIKKELPDSNEYSSIYISTKIDVSILRKEKLALVGKATKYTNTRLK